MRQNFFKNKNFKIILAIFIFLLISSIALGLFFYREKKKETGKGLIGSNMSISFPAQTIKSDLTSFFINTESTNIESIKAYIKYKNPSSVPKEIKLGIKGSEKNRYFYKILYQKLLQNCDWESIASDKDTLYQKNKNYKFLSELYNSPPNKDKIAVYNSDRQILLNDADQINNKAIKREIELMGTHNFIVKVDKLPFVFKLSKQDINAYPGEDKYLVSLSKDGQIIEEKTIEDDGFTGREGLRKEPQIVEFKFDKIDLGVYEILAKFEGEEDDSFINLVETNQTKMVIKNVIHLLKEAPIILYANNLPLSLKVAKNCSQTITLDNNIPLEIEKEGEKYKFDLPKLSPNKNLHKLEIPLAHLYFISFGYFAFSPEEYFDPEMPLYGVDLNTITSLDKIDYLLTSVPRARQEGEWLINEVIIDGKDIKIDENKKLYFSLEIPDLQKEGGSLEIESFNIEVKILGLLATKLSRDNITPSPTPTSKLPSPIGEKTPAANITPIPTPTIAVGKNIKIRVLNAGAPAGYAKKYADMITAAGYLNVEIGNITEEALKETSIVYPQSLAIEANAIENILKPEYQNIINKIDNGILEIIVNISTLSQIKTE